MDSDRLWLKHEDDGYLFPYTLELAQHPKLFEVTEKEAFPEKFKPPHIARKAGRKRQDSLDSQLEMALSEPDETTTLENAELNAEASKGLPK